MSYASDKVPCKTCGDFFDPDLLNANSVCRDCVLEESFIQDTLEDWNKE